MEKLRNRSVRAALCICLLACFALALGLPAQTANNNGDTDLFSAIDPHSYVDRTSAVIYDSTNGLPTNGVNDIAQTEEGFLWIGSYCGLIRYDGNYFELLDASSGLSSIESLFVDSQDRLWIGTNDSGLALMDRGELRFWDEDHGFPSAKVGDVQESEDGTIYVATTEGLVMITPDLVAHTADDPRLADAYVEQLLTDAVSAVLHEQRNHGCHECHDESGNGFCRYVEALADAVFRVFLCCVSQSALHIADDGARRERSPRHHIHLQTLSFGYCLAVPLGQQLVCLAEEVGCLGVFQGLHAHHLAVAYSYVERHRACISLDVACQQSGVDHHRAVGKVAYGVLPQAGTAVGSHFRFLVAREFVSKQLAVASQADGCHHEHTRDEA